MSVLMWLQKSKAGRTSLPNNKGIRETFVTVEKVKVVCQGSLAKPGINISLKLLERSDYIFVPIS